MKRLVVTMSREAITEDMEQLQRESDEGEKSRQKENVLQKLKRLMPGSTTAVAAI